MSHRVEWAKQARKRFLRLDQPTQKRILQAIDRLSEEGRGDLRSLEGSSDNLYRLRVGGWRVLFAYDEDDTLFILKIGARGDVYKR